VLFRSTGWWVWKSPQIHAWVVSLGANQYDGVFRSKERASRSKQTSLLPIDINLHIGLLKWSPLEVFLVSSTLHISPLALLAARLLLAALQTLCFARNTACVHARNQQAFPKEKERKGKERKDEVESRIPLRLLDCLGFDTEASPPGTPAPPALAFLAAFFFASVLCRRACLGGCDDGGAGSGLDRKNTEGEGIVMASAIWLLASRVP